MIDISLFLNKLYANKSLCLSVKVLLAAADSTSFAPNTTRSPAILISIPDVLPLVHSSSLNLLSNLPSLIFLVVSSIAFLCIYLYLDLPLVL